MINTLIMFCKNKHEHEICLFNEGFGHHRPKVVAEIIFDRGLYCTECGEKYGEWQIVTKSDCGMTAGERILFHLLQDARRSLIWISNTDDDLSDIKTYASARAGVIKNATFGFAYGASPATIREKLNER